MRVEGGKKVAILKRSSNPAHKIGIKKSDTYMEGVERTKSGAKEENSREGMLSEE